MYMSSEYYPNIITMVIMCVAITCTLLSFFFFSDHCVQEKDVLQHACENITTEQIWFDV